MTIIISEKKQVNNIIKRVVKAGLGDIIKYLDYKHPELTMEEKQKILQEKWFPQLIEDGMSTGHFTLDNKRLRVVIQQEMSVVAGFIFEAFIVKKLKKDTNFFFKLFKWTTNRKKLKKSILKQYFPIGLGHKSTSEKYPSFYEPNMRKFDIIFLRYNQDIEEYEEATVVNTTIRAGVQVKAIRGNEKKEIITPILENKYDSVITLLKHSDNIHSYDYCMETIKKMYENKEINFEQRVKLENSITAPRNMGLDQDMIDEYYDFITHWYNEEAKADKLILKGVNLGIQESIYGKSKIF